MGVFLMMSLLYSWGMYVNLFRSTSMFFSSGMLYLIYTFKHTQNQRVSTINSHTLIIQIYIVSWDESCFPQIHILKS